MGELPADEPEDCPGRYVVTHHNAAVREAESLDSTVVARLVEGQVVQVLKVIQRPDLKRVRARIENPAGWITLLETEVGYRWAVQHSKTAKAAKFDSEAIEKARLLEAVQHCDIELRELLCLVERLRAERQRSLQNSLQRCANLEARILAGYKLRAVSPDDVPKGKLTLALEANASKLKVMADRLGSKPPGWVPTCTPEETERLALEAKDPRWRVPLGLPAGSKVVGFRRKPADAEVTPSPDATPEDEPVPIWEREATGRLINANRLLQPPPVLCKPIDGVISTPGVYPLMRPEIDFARINLLEGRAVPPKAHQTYRFKADMMESRRFPDAREVPSYQYLDTLNETAATWQQSYVYVEESKLPQKEAPRDWAKFFAGVE